MDDLITPAIAARVARVRAGGGEARRLHVADLRPGAYGALDVDVRHIHAAHTFARRGGQGTLRRVTVGDATGEIDIVLWGDEGRLAIHGPLLPGAHVRLRGAEVRDGFRGGMEIHLGQAVLETLDAPAAKTVEGHVLELSETRPVGEPPGLRFQADLRLQCGEGTAHVLLWDDAIKKMRSVLPGAHVRLQGCRAHPALEGWFVADGARIDL